MQTASSMVRIILIAGIFAGFTACDRNDVVPDLPAAPKPDGEALHQWFENSTENSTQYFTFNSSVGGHLTGDEGTILQFSADAFTKENGDAVTGDVDIEFIEVYDRASMILTNRPTNGKTTDGKISTLVSGGEFYVNATQNGSQLKLKYGFTIVAPTENTGNIDNAMKVFEGETTCDSLDCDLIWIENDDRGIEVGEFQTAGGMTTAYYVFQTKFGWTNIDRWYNDPRPKTTIFIDVPENFNNTNCAVYIAYDDEPTALASFDKYDDESELFTEHYGLIPIGLKVHFIFVSIIEDEIHYALQPATIVENHVEVIDEVKSITEDELVDLIKALP
jgi:hypothetical protein